MNFFFSQNGKEKLEKMEKKKVRVAGLDESVPFFPPCGASCILRHALTHTDSHRHTHTELVPN